ncbi:MULTISPECIES: DUF885 domain-containing protein [Clostridia]|uniref:DUF885 domain-containing protein n=1 Tax=Clostridia TaxID=186801 RepID=UPI000E48D5BF|nr:MULTISPECIES: DUF885 domain-containing protein [Clostridia]RHU99879.1 DUF885 domain-containing protein [Firmicutes bacterium OM07-11]RKQ27884.1 DUF885 family protein [Ruminococcus sp. B05]TAP31895.1 DUF885 domain-containing protein [Mediterraneibacter sp. gm002]
MSFFRGIQENKIEKGKKNVNYITARKIKAFSVIAGTIGILLLSGCQSQTSSGQDRRFRQFTKQLFCQELSSNTISLHYTLKNPKEYDIRENEVTFGTFPTDNKNLLASVENLEEVLKTFDYNKLSVENSLTYDVLKCYLNMTERDADYILYDEPMGLVSGVQTQLPVILSEYPFYEQSDVDTYLQLMKTTPEYFASLLKFEQKKSKAGLFMSDKMAEQVIEQCKAFRDMEENNYLYSTFAERVQTVTSLSDKQKSDYIQKNARMIKEYVLPAYDKLICEIEKLKGSGKNEQGLCYLPRGKDYYEQVVEASTGSMRSVEEIRDMTRRQMTEDLEAMERVMKISEKEVNASIPQNPTSILQDLQTKITTSFPKLPDTTYEVKYVPKAMQEHLSPAFYMIPAIDAYNENVIYVNEAQIGNTMALFTTLAHEGYPGHLYQTVYFANTNPDPIRTILNFGGYVEGWATYAEMCSYYLAPLTKDQATLLQKNSSIVLGLYTLADIGIHYDGWSREDAIAFYKKYGIGDEDNINRIYDLILGSPGNYLKYYVGYVEFLELKKDWVKEYGSQASQKEFHKAVLDVGPAPFKVVEKYIGRELDK